MLEMCCREALNEEKIGARFKDDIVNAMEKMGLQKINWSNGIWQEVLNLKKLRNSYTHINILQEHLFPEIIVADNTIKLVREAAKDIYKRAGKDIPKWLDDDIA